MILQKMTKPQCLLYSAAMVLDANVEDMIKCIGYSGLERIWDLPEPACYRSHHIQEIIEYAVMMHSKCLYPIEHSPIMAPNLRVEPIKAGLPNECETVRFMRLVAGRKGIMIGQYKGCPHAWAWDGSKCYDPQGFIRDISDYEIINECWVLGSI